jgi:hypothetical protein
MIRISVAFAALAVLAWLSAANGADRTIEVKSGAFTIEVAVRAQANLIYHIDCVARSASCTSEVFEQLWRSEFGITDDDRKQLKAWKAIREPLSQSSGGRLLAVKASVPIYGPDDEVAWSKVRYAEFLASDLAALKRGWSPLLPAESVERLAAIVEHFRPRFDAWWRTHESEALQFLPGVEAALHKARAGELLGKAARFFRSELGDRRLFLHVFLQPTTKQQHSQAGLVGPHLTVEVVAKEDAAERAGVIVHELSHHLFARMPGELKARFADALINEGAAGMAAWNLFNEVQATVIGNMLAERNVQSPEAFQKMLAQPQSLYADEAIDLGARASEKLFVTAFKKGGAIGPAFAQDFVAALKAGMGDLLETPSLYLRGMVLNTDDENSPWFAKIRRAVRAWSISGHSPLGTQRFVESLEESPGVGAVVVAMADQVPQLAPAAKALGVTTEGLTAALGASRGVVVISKRSTNAYSFVFLARDARAMDGLIASFPFCGLKPSVCLRIE